ncbi:AMP-binding protein [Acidocella sp.]|jgi:long-chain acyl-CoA synthetase|uniref:AMP-binding protein n=1 Tax=Acidocella sp. TaxID=50710 RepID=UPI002F41E3B3
MTHPRTLQELLLSLRAYGSTLAIIATGRDDASTLSFAELFDASQQFAKAIASRDLEGAHTIGLMAPNSLAWIEAFFGIVAAGAIAMPIDVQTSDEDLQRMLAIGECRLVLAGAGQIDRLRNVSLSCQAVDLDAILAMPQPEPPDAVPGILLPPTDPHDVAVLAFTSGTTGTPKAVPLSHANLMSNVEALVVEGIIGPHDRALVPLPFHHAYPLTVGILTVLASGATIVLPAGLSGPQLVEAIREGHATALLGVPRLYDALLANIRAEVARQSRPVQRLFPLALATSSLIHRHSGIPAGRWAFGSLHTRIGPTLRLMVSGGAALSAEVETTLIGLGWRVLTGYGLTETSPILAFNRPGRSRIGASGQALPGVRLRIATPDAEGAGEIEASGRSVFTGYRHDDAATRNAFTADGWFRTDDLGRLDAGGYLFILARARETIVLPSGKKIDSESIEKAYAADPLIREIAVLPRAAGLAALIVPNDEAVRKAGALRIRGLVHDALNMRARTLPPHLRLTGFAVTRLALPRTQLGKLRRHLLPALYESAHAARGAAQEAVLSEADTALLAQPLAAAVWHWIHTRYPDQAIALDTSPQLDLGVDSLGWLDLTLTLEHEFGIALTEQQSARIVTLRDLLREVVTAAPSQAEPPGLLASQNIWLTPYGPGVRAARFAGEAFLRGIMGIFFRLHVDGRQNLPPSPFLVCPNHVSYLDAFALAAALPHRKLQSTYWAGWTGLLAASRLRRLFSRAAQVIPIDPDRAAAAGIALGSAVLSRGRTLVWFPEGGLSPDGSLQPFQPGIGLVLEQHPVPVVPAYISGTAAALPPGKRLPRLRQIAVRFGAPLDPKAAAPDATGRAHQQAIAEAIRAAVAALSPTKASSHGHES